MLIKSSESFVHFGSSSFDAQRWRSIKNDDYFKPIGGLWASPVKARFGWFSFCEDNNFESKLDKHFEFGLSPDARILKTDSREMVDALPRSTALTPYQEFHNHYVTKKGRPPIYPIDFEKLAVEYDVIEFFASNFFCPDRILQGWDCDSILVMNPDVIRFQSKEQSKTLSGLSDLIESAASRTDDSQKNDKAEHTR